MMYFLAPLFDALLVLSVGVLLGGAIVKYGLRINVTRTKQKENKKQQEAPTQEMPAQKKK